MQATLQMDCGKREPAAIETTVAAAEAFSGRSQRLFLEDRKTGRKFLVDSGADVSVIPAHHFKKNKSSEYKLFAANGTPIPTYGMQILNLDLGLRRSFQWPFIIAETTKGIIGADFLHHYELLIDLKNKKLIDNRTKLSVVAEIAFEFENISINTIGNIKYNEILKSFPEITKPVITPSSKIKHNVEHFIKTSSGPPIYSKFRRLPPEKLQIVQQEFQLMLEHKIIQPSSSQWASPIHLVKKKNGSWRVCGDYRRLNARTIPDRYPLPRIEDVSNILHNKNIFSKIDLQQAYYQIPIAKEDKEKTAVITPFGLFEFNFMPFGLRNAPATFQRFISNVLRGLDFVFYYLDDILIASENEKAHESHLKILFKRMNDFGLKINMSKSLFSVPNISFLGYLVTPKGITADPERVTAILDQKSPETIIELRRFLGAMNFYRPFLKNAAENQCLLNEFLKGAKKNDQTKIIWTPESLLQFDKCKKELADAALLTCPNDKYSLGLFTDASNVAIGCALQQQEADGWKPIGFFSRKLNQTQRNYSTYDRELLSIYESIKYFRYLLETRKFIIYTDHKPLTFAYAQNNEKASPRQLRHLQFISQFSTDIRHIVGKENVVADQLSRLEEVELIDHEIIAQEQKKDSELTELKSNNSLELKAYNLKSGEKLWCDVSTKNIRIYIPPKFRKNIFDLYHNLSHPGIKASVKLLSSKVIWTKINKDVSAWAKSCVDCQKSKISRHTKTPNQMFPKVDERFSTVHLDLIGPMPCSEGFSYCLTLIDRFTCWTEAVPIQNISADTVARAFYANWISRFGTPKNIISDQGTQFQSELFRKLSEFCGIKMKRTTAYHPQCNGKIERFHRTLKTALMAHGNVKWTQTLPTVLLGLRSALNSSNLAVAEMVYGVPLRLPGDFLSEPSQQTINEDNFVGELRKYMSKLQPVPSKHKNKCSTFVHKDLNSTEYVFVRIDRVKKSLERPFEGPYKVLNRTEKYFTLDIKTKAVNISIDRLKPAYTIADPQNSNDFIIPKKTTGEKPKENVKITHPNSEPTLTLPIKINNQADSGHKTSSGRVIKNPVRFANYVT